MHTSHQVNLSLPNNFIFPVFFYMLDILMRNYRNYRIMIHLLNQKLNLNLNLNLSLNLNPEFELNFRQMKMTRM